MPNSEAEAGGSSSPDEVGHRLGPYHVSVPTVFGPRLLGLRYEQSPEILVRLAPGVAADVGGAGLFHFRGGHRLWASPEVPGLTYAPDDDPCEVSFVDGMLRISGPVDAAGFVKELQVTSDGHRLVVDHRLGWRGSGSVTAGAWSITQLPLGGTAVLPLGGHGGGAYQADRSLVVWPYTDLADPRLSFRSAAAVITAHGGPPLKLGSGPAPGRLGYLRAGWLFTKTVEAAAAGPYPDLGAVGQVFTNDDFCELESLGPLVALQPGADVRHREVWQVDACPDTESALDRVVAPP